jgi:molecular chaperone GrpE
MKIPVRYVGSPDEERKPRPDPPGNEEDRESSKADEERAGEKAEAAEKTPVVDYLERGGEEDWRNMYVRLLADFENFKRHSRAERERLAQVGKEAVLGDLFPLMEHLERALEVAEEAGDEGMLSGLKMVHQELISALQKHGVERVETVGRPFDPRRHEALGVVTRAGVEADTVVEEVSPGFMREGKLLRPAGVLVAR